MTTLLLITMFRQWPVSYTHLDVYKRQQEAILQIRSDDGDIWLGLAY